MMNHTKTFPVKYQHILEEPLSAPVVAHKAKKFFIKNTATNRNITNTTTSTIELNANASPLLLQLKESKKDSNECEPACYQFLPSVTKMTRCPILAESSTISSNYIKKKLSNFTGVAYVNPNNSFYFKKCNEFLQPKQQLKNKMFDKEQQLIVFDKEQLKNKTKPVEIMDSPDMSCPSSASGGSMNDTPKTNVRSCTNNLSEDKSCESSSNHTLLSTSLNTSSISIVESYLREFSTANSEKLLKARKMKIDCRQQISKQSDSEKHLKVFQPVAIMKHTSSRKTKMNHKRRRSKAEMDAVREKIAEHYRKTQEVVRNIHEIEQIKEMDVSTERKKEAFTTLSDFEKQAVSDSVFLPERNCPMFTDCSYMKSNLPESDFCWNRAINGQICKYPPMHKFLHGISNYSVSEVSQFLCSVKYLDDAIAQRFVEQMIDGEALLLLTQEDLVDKLDVKLGPAVKLFDVLTYLRHKC